MKNKLLIISLLVICLALVAGGTYAAYTYESTARNVITSGSLDVKIHEQQIVDDEFVPYPGDDAIEVMPGRVVSKVVTVENIDNNAFVRATYDITVLDSNGEPIEIDSDTIWVEGASSEWVSGEDGWFYYNKVLKSGEVTSSLFKEVHFSGKKIDNRFSGCAIKVAVRAEAVQADNNGESAIDAQGWIEK